MVKNLFTYLHNAVQSPGSGPTVKTYSISIASSSHFFWSKFCLVELKVSESESTDGRSWRDSQIYTQTGGLPDSCKHLFWSGWKLPATLQPSREQDLTHKTRNLYNSPLLFKTANTNLVFGCWRQWQNYDPPFGKDRLIDGSLGATSFCSVVTNKKQKEICSLTLYWGRSMDFHRYWRNTKQRETASEDQYHFFQLT